MTYHLFAGAEDRKISAEILHVRGLLGSLLVRVPNPRIHSRRRLCDPESVSVIENVTVSLSIENGKNINGRLVKVKNGVE